MGPLWYSDFLLALWNIKSSWTNCEGGKHLFSFYFLLISFAPLPSFPAFSPSLHRIMMNQKWWLFFNKSYAYPKSEHTSTVNIEQWVLGVNVSCLLSCECFHQYRDNWRNCKLIIIQLIYLLICIMSII